MALNQAQDGRRALFGEDAAPGATDPLRVSELADAVPVPTVASVAPVPAAELLPPDPARRPTRPAPPPSRFLRPDAATTPDPSALRIVQLSQHTVEYLLRRSSRRSIGFMIDDNGLRVTAPKRLGLADIDNAIRAKQGWILSKLHERHERRAQRQQRPPVVWGDGAALPYLGGEITLRLHQAPRLRASFDADSAELHVWLTPLSTEQHLQEKVKTWLQQDARRLFKERLDVYAAQLGVDYHSFALSSAGTRWGSCTAQRKIRLNWRLVHFSLPLIDYVVAHELSHLREMNHSPRFWATVASIYPDYDGAKHALRKQAQDLPVLFS